MEGKLLFKPKEGPQKNQGFPTGLLLGVGTRRTLYLRKGWLKTRPFPERRVPSQGFGCADFRRTWKFARD